MAYSNEEKEKIFDHIFKEIREGRAVRKILKEDEGMPEASTFFIWLDADEEKSKQYARAMEFRADAMFEEILDIADESSEDFKTNSKGDNVFDAEHVQRSRLRVDARKWAASKLNPKKYGDRIDMTSNGKTITERPQLVFKAEPHEQGDSNPS